jgi:hypothetical protein
VLVSLTPTSAPKVVKLACPEQERNRRIPRMKSPFFLISTFHLFFTRPLFLFQYFRTTIFLGTSYFLAGTFPL